MSAGIFVGSYICFSECICVSGYHSVCVSGCICVAVGNDTTNQFQQNYLQHIYQN